MSATDFNRALPAEVAERVDRYRAEKLARLDSVLSGLPGARDWDGPAGQDLPLRYALAHHVFEGVSRAAGQGQAGRVAELLRLRTDQSPLRPLATEAGPVLVANPDGDRLVADEALATSPVALLDAEVAATASPADRDLVSRALATATAAGFGATVRRNTGVVVLIAERRPTDTAIRSWTTNALPATVHLDYFADHEHVSRDLIHEAAHSELNDLFAAYGVGFPDGVTYYAPWLDTQRPVFGFLHGSWAFSHVALYCQWLAAADADPDVRALGAALHAKYAEHMHAARADFDEAVRLVEAEPVAALLRSCRDAVLASFHPA
ncbi:HEXXH motif-containing protein [Crossiella equi]|uniref:HEXXH motif-containing protein n=1 Tax=Crossiella equi TaxID=130796 RepID=A0ABS5A5I0_9PSEU|nr:HEXXH motif-containing putative peptide modification protein [Crossiella equi]MBP2471859.1 HEXXH motif-containing protein [Crossiella equi]